MFICQAPLCFQFTKKTNCLLVVCGRLLVVCDRLLSFAVGLWLFVTVCGCLLVVCGHLWSFAGGLRPLWSFVVVCGGLWSLLVLVVNVSQVVFGLWENSRMLVSCDMVMRFFGNH